MTTLKVDDRAPDFTLPATTDESVTLSQYRGQKNVALTISYFTLHPLRGSPCSLPSKKSSLFW